MPSNAFVTLLTTASYLPGALVLLHALHDLHPAPRDFQIIVLVTPETVDAKTIGELRKAGYDLVIGVEPIGSGLPGQESLNLMGTWCSDRTGQDQGANVWLTLCFRPTRPQPRPHQTSSFPTAIPLFHSDLP